MLANVKEVKFPMRGDERGRLVVPKSIDPWFVVGGNPAKFIKKRELKG